MSSNPAPTLTRGQAWALALVATFTMAVSYFDRQTLAVIAPTVTEAMKLTETQYGWLASAFSIAYLVGAPLAGRWIDRVGARRGLIIAVIVWSVVAGLHALAPTFAVLFALRILLGFAEAPSFPGAAQTIHRALPADARPRAFGILFTGSSIGATLIAPIASRLLGTVGWRGAFLATALMGLVWVPIWMIVAFNARAKLALDHHSTSEEGGSMSLLQVIGHRAVLRGVVLVFAASPALAFVFLWLTKYLTHEFSMSREAIGDYALLPFVFFDVGAVVFGDLAARRRKKRAPGAPDRLLVAIAAMITTSIAFMSLATTPLRAIVVAGATMVGGGGLFALLTGDMLARVPPKIVSRAGGMTAASQSLAYIIASPLVGWSVDRYGSYAYALAVLGMWVIPGTLVWILWTPPAAHVE